MEGYWENREANAETLRDGWLHTGDLGTIDADGFLTLGDRSKDLIISGGSNIYPREIEEVLLNHPVWSRLPWSAAARRLGRGGRRLRRRKARRRGAEAELDACASTISPASSGRAIPLCRIFAEEQVRQDPKD